MKDKAQQIIDSLDLRAHPEGGFFREIFRSEQTVEWQGETLCAGTAIYFLLLDGDRSWCHRIPQDEVWQFFEGDPFELVFFHENDLQLQRIVLSDSNRTFVVPGGAWQAARTRGDYSLIGCTVSPGFEFRLFELLAAVPEKQQLFYDGVDGLKKFEAP